MTDTRRIDLACIALMEDPARMKTLLAQMGDTAQQLQDNARWQFPGWDIQAAAYGFTVEDLSHYGLTAWRNLKDRVREKSPGADHTHWMMGNVSAGNAGGRADLGGTHSVVASAGDFRIAYHELGHNLGAKHHVSGKLTGPVAEYGGYDVPGTGNSFGAPYLDYFGVLAHVAKGDGRHYLADPATRNEAVAPGEVQIAYIERDNRWWSISYFDGQVWIDTNRGGFKAEPPWNTVHAVKSLRPGQSWKDVTFVGVHQGIAEITAGKAEPRPVPKVARPTAAVPMQAGHWFTPDWTHQGIQVFERAGQAYVYWFTWSASGPFWMVGKGPIEDDVAHLTFYVVDDKTRARDLVIAGGGYLHFSDANAGALTYWTDLADRYWPGRGVLPLTRSIWPEPHPLYGAYDLGASNGVSAHVVDGRLMADDDQLEDRPIGDQVVGIWWDFDFGSFLPDPTWYLFTGPVGGTLTVYEPKGGLPQTATGSHLNRWGECELRQKAFTYRKDGWSKAKTERLERLI